MMENDLRKCYDYELARFFEDWAASCFSPGEWKLLCDVLPEGVVVDARSCWIEACRVELGWCFRSEVGLRALLLVCPDEFKCDVDAALDVIEGDLKKS